MAASTSVIDTHLHKFPPAQAAALLKMRDAVARMLPGAEQVLAWGMPAFRIDGDAVLGFEGFKNHNSLFPMSGGVIARLQRELAGYEVTKGTTHFPLGKPIPVSILRVVVTTRIAEINDSYPRKSGEFKEFYSNGFLKAKGRMKDGQRRGTWSRYRRDGSLVEVTKES